jgi:hypothetical protein
MKPSDMMGRRIQLTRDPAMATVQTPATLDDSARVSEKAELIDGRIVGWIFD